MFDSTAAMFVTSKPVALSGRVVGRAPDPASAYDLSHARFSAYPFRSPLASGRVTREGNWRARDLAEQRNRSAAAPRSMLGAARRIERGGRRFGVHQPADRVGLRRDDAP